MLGSNGYVVNTNAPAKDVRENVLRALDQLAAKRKIGMIEAKRLGLETWMRDMICEIRVRDAEPASQVTSSTVYTEAVAIAPNFQGGQYLLLGYHEAPGGSAVYVGTAGFPGKHMAKAYSSTIESHLASAGFTASRKGL